jgi:methionine-rich copper-binding protein CopC
MSKKIIIATYLLITALILNSVIVFASGGNDTYIKVLKTNPVNNQTNIKIDNIITLKFSGKVLKGKEFNKISLKTAKKSIKITSSISSDTLTVKSKSKMDYDTKYTLSIPVGSIKDPSGKSQAKNYILLFTTCSKPVT